MPAIIVYSERGQQELGRGDSDQQFKDHPLTITFYNDKTGMPQEGTDYLLADAQNAEQRAVYTVKEVDNEPDLPITITFY